MPFAVEPALSEISGTNSGYGHADNARYHEAERLEVARVAALRRYRNRDTGPDPAFDRIVSLAADLLDAPIAMISFADETGQWVKAAIGLDPAEHGVARALSEQTMQRRCVHIVPEPGLLGAAGIAFYAAAPLMTPDGVALGALSVLDRTGRAGLSGRDLCRLEELAALVMDLLERQREHNEQNRDRAEIALMHDIHAVLMENLSFADTLNLILCRMLRAFDAYACRVWERRGNDPHVSLVSRVCVDPIVLGHHEGMADEQVPLGDLVTAELFESEEATLWRTIDSTDLDHPRVGPAFSAGISSLIGCSLTVGDRRFGLVMTMKDPQADLPGRGALLGRVGKTLRPVLQRKLGNERTALLGAALEATYDGVIIAEITYGEDSYLRIVYINAALTEQTGYQPKDLLGQPLTILNVPSADDAAEIRRIKAAMRRGENVRTMLRRRRRDGSDFWAETTLVPLFDADGVATHRVGIMRDMTQQRAEAEELRTRERRLLATTQKLEKLTAQLIRTQGIARLGTWRQEIGSENIEWSDSVYPMFGETKGHFSPTLPAIIAKIHPDNREALRARLLQARQGAVTNALDYLTIAADGTVRTVSSECICEYDGDGRVIAISGILQDVTEQKHAQAMLLQAEKLRSIGQLTGGIAHDFNNLLTVVSVNLEMLGDMLGTDHPAEELRAMALRAAESGAKLTGNLLAFARRQSLQPEPYEVNLLLRGLKDMAAHSIGERYPIALKLEATLPHCLLDRSGFESAMLNLLVNSRDAMPDGGTITIATSLEHLRPGGSNASGSLRDGAYICVLVSDTGTGIEPHLQERVFEPFFTTKPVGKGTGLGLSTVIGFVRQSGGDVALASTPCLGTRVTLYLPVQVTSDVSTSTDRTPGRLASSPIG